MSFFEIMAECSIALAGFGAIHAALRGAHLPRGILRAWTVVLHAVMAFILCVIPMLLELIDPSPGLLWTVSGWLGLVLTGLVFTLSVRVDARMTQIGHPPQAPLIIRSAQSAVGLAVLLMLATALLSPASFRQLCYGSGVVLMLSAGILALLHSFLVPLQHVFEAEEGPTKDGKEDAGRFSDREA